MGVSVVGTEVRLKLLLHFSGWHKNIRIYGFAVRKGKLKSADKKHV